MERECHAGKMLLQAEHHQRLPANHRKPEERPGQIFPPGLRRNQPLGHLIAAFWPPEPSATPLLLNPPRPGDCVGRDSPSKPIRPHLGARFLQACSQRQQETAETDLMIYFNLSCPKYHYSSVFSMLKYYHFLWSLGVV